jgi:hypothetical protein
METTAINVTIMPHWVSVAEFAKRTGVQPRTVHLRIKRGALSCARVDGIVVMDVNATLVPRVRKDGKNRAAPFVWLPHLPPMSNLISVSEWCERNNLRGHNIYRSILGGRMRAWYFAERVFVERTEALGLPVKRIRKR